MPGKISKAQNIPCGICGYPAWSQADLDSHMRAVHGAGKADAPVVSATPVSKPAPVPPPTSVPTPAAPKATADLSPSAPVQKPAPPAEPPTHLTEMVKAPEKPADVPPKTEKPRKLPDGIFVPDKQPDFWVSERTGRELYIIGKKSDRGEVVMAKFLGPAGCGKTSLGFEFAAAMKRPVFWINWGAVQEQSQVFGKDEADVKVGTKYSVSKYIEALETTQCVVICDEPNRCPPEVMNTNLDLWDWRHAAWSNDLKRLIRIAPGVCIFACMNEGSDYIGINPLDKAVRERFGRTIRLSWPPMKEESQILQHRTGIDKDNADKLAKFAMQVRRDKKVGCQPSTRQLLVAAEDVVDGLPINEAVMYSIINDLDENADRKALLQHLQVIGGIDEAWVEEGGENA